MPNTRALGGDAAAGGMYRSVHHAAGGPPGWAGEDDHGHQCWPGWEKGSKQRRRSKPTFTKCRALTSISMFNLLFIIPILQMTGCDLFLVMWQLSGRISAQI